ncbi:hypothetical protein [Castellaniella sp.]|uniref:hypothetical protein n=1 Tax=Castellaniella sp. TaxID=1955812 RepID=UPI002AFE0A23|nr:hypothetical protein [Castellaniella sp.]
MNAPDWIETLTGRNRRDLRAAAPAPQALPLLDPEQAALLRCWVRSDAQRRSRAALLKDAGPSGIEGAETLCDRLLADGWITRSERLKGGAWHWEAIAWHDLPRLQTLLGVAGPRQRAENRQALLDQAQDWLHDRRAAMGSPNSDLFDALRRALTQLDSERTLSLDRLAGRLALLRALVDWQDQQLSGTRRDFALHAGGATKALSAADWQWLEAGFDLEQLRVSRFAPMIWIAGDLTLSWDAGQSLSLGALHCLGVPADDVLQAAAVSPPQRWWLIENRASFERQARCLPPGVALVWMPGRPPMAWIHAMTHLLRRAPAPAWISADADPAGVDIACQVGASWQAAGLDWEPHQMGLEQWAATPQYWPLNDHDRQLLQRLLARSDLPAGLRALCEAMQTEGRKAEQEGWI